MWLYGYVAMWLSSKISKFQEGPLPENREVTKFHCMPFDRYETHIQTFVGSIPIVIIFDPHLHEKTNGAEGFQQKSKSFKCSDSQI